MLYLNKYVTNSAFRAGSRMMLACVAIVLLSTTISEATIFRHGELSWKPRPDLGPRTVEFTMTVGARRNFFTPIPNVGSTLPASTLTLNTAGASGDNPPYQVFAVDVAGNWVMARRQVIRTYTTNGPHLAFANQCCRVSNTQNSHDQFFRLETTVRFDIPNASPITSMPPFVSVPAGSIATFRVPGLDFGCDELSWRFATSQEMAAVLIGPPNAPNVPMIDAETGQVTWNTAGTTAGHFYSMQAVVEESRNGNVIGKTPVDFILLILPNNPGDSPPCDVTPPGPFEVAPGGTLTFSVSTQGTPGSQINLRSTAVPSGATFTPPMPQFDFQGGALATTFEWTPTVNQLGPHLITFFSYDSSNRQTISVVEVLVQEPSTDCNNNGTPDECELDQNDCNLNGILDECDIANETSHDCNNNGIPDECELDSDGDGVIDDCDNCPLEFNPDQADWDGDGIGDVCDPDIDGDGVPNEIDMCPQNTPGLPVDCEGRPLRDCNGDCLVDALDIQCIADEMLNQ